MATEEKQEEKKKDEPKPKGPPKSTFREYFESLTVTLIMALFGMTFIIQAVTVPTGSMQNTILVGDYLLVNKFIFNPGGSPLPFLPMREIERGDIIVFKYPGNKGCPANDRAHGSSATPYQMNYVKRVIGLPGETVEFKNNQVFINGQPHAEHRVIGDAASNVSALETTEFEPIREGEDYNVYYSKNSMAAVKAGSSRTRTSNDPCQGYQFGVEGKPSTVPDNHFFVMGDSRDNSEDSRYWGFVPRELVVGRALFVYWSCDRGASNGDMLGCLTHPRLDRIGKFVK